MTTWAGRRAGASSHNFPTDSPGGATLFNFVVTHSGSKLLHTGGRQRWRHAGRCHWLVACSVRRLGKAGGDWL